MRRSSVRALVGTLAPVALLAVTTTTAATADTFTVTTTTDGGAGSLREAIEDLATNAGGGGIATVGDAVTVLIEDSTISGNTARNGGGVGVTAGSSVTVVNSTITGNHADGGPGTGVGGGLESNGGGTWVFTYATIADNTANSGGANLGIGSEAEIFVTQSVIANGDCSLNGNSVTSGFNVTTETNCGLEAVSDTLVADAQLAPLGAYGGPTLTRAPLAGSPVIDVVPNADCEAGQDGITADQRGFPRPEVAGGLCDAGAVEGDYAPTTPVTPTTPAVTPAVVITPAFTG